MDARQAFRAIRQGDTAPIYVCYGTEAYRMNEFAERVLEVLVEPDLRDLAVIRYDTAETPVEAIVEEAGTMPFLVPRKVILVKDSVLFAAGKESGKVEHRPERLHAYLEQPAETTVLLFLVPHEKLDERKKLVKKAKADNRVLAFTPLSAEELATWVTRRAEKQGRSMDGRAAGELLGRVGADMQRLAAETDKLCLYAGEGGAVTSDSVRELVPAATEQNVFRLTEELAALNTDRAVALYYDLLRQKEEPIKLLALLVRQVRNMLLVKELGVQGYSPQQMAAPLGLHPYAAKITADQARRFSAERLAALLAELAELDYALKTGRIEKTLGLELFLLRTGSRGVG